MHTTHKHPHTPSHLHRSKVDALHQKVGEVSTNTVHDIHITTVTVVPVTHELETGDTIPELSIPLILILILILIVLILGFWQVQYDT